MKIGVILAAGKSSRFKSSIPKGLHNIDGKSIVERIIDCFFVAKVDKIYIIVSDESYCCYKKIKGVDFLFQGDLRGTGGAFYSLNGLFKVEDEIIVINSDCFMFDKKVILNFYDRFINCCYDMGVITIKVNNPFGYGRIFKNNDRIKIIEENEADDLIRKIDVVNSGIYIFRGKYLIKNMRKLNIKDKESKITSFFNNEKCLDYFCDSPIRGVNSKEDFGALNKEFYLFNCYKHMKNGVKIYDSDNTYIGDDVIIGENVEIFPSSYILGKSRIDDNSVIYPFSFIIDSCIGKENIIGPYSYIRDNSIIKDNAFLGSFLEVKNSIIGENVKAKHHGYIGDCEIGKSSNIGCGFVSANYDGKKKNKIVIGDNNFIGSNVTIVAPVRVGNNVIIGAGSTITNDINDNCLAIAREKQINKEGYSLKGRESE